MNVYVLWKSTSLAQQLYKLHFNYPFFEYCAWRWAVWTVSLWGILQFPPKFSWNYRMKPCENLASETGPIFSINLKGIKFPAWDDVPVYQQVSAALGIIPERSHCLQEWVFSSLPLEYGSLPLEYGSLPLEYGSLPL